MAAGLLGELDMFLELLDRNRTSGLGEACRRQVLGSLRRWQQWIDLTLNESGDYADICKPTLTDCPPEGKRLS